MCSLHSWGCGAHSLGVLILQPHTGSLKLSEQRFSTQPGVASVNARVSAASCLSASASSLAPGLLRRWFRRWSAFWFHGCQVGLHARLRRAHAKGAHHENGRSLRDSWARSTYCTFPHASGSPNTPMSMLSNVEFGALFLLGAAPRSRLLLRRYARCLSRTSETLSGVMLAPHAFPGLS